MKGNDLDIPQELIYANDLQRGGQYKASRERYTRFLDENPTHPLRFKSLFEVADNLFYEKQYAKATDAYRAFIRYCESQQNVTSEEQGWIETYLKLADSRMHEISRKDAKPDV